MFSVYIRKIISIWVFESIIFVLLKRSLYNCNLFVIGIYVKCLTGKYTPKNTMINFFSHKKKNSVRWNNVNIIATSRESPVNFTLKNTMINFFFHKKKKNKFRPTPQNGRFPILRPNLRPILGNRKFFFLKIQLVYVFGVKFTGKYHVVGIISQLFRDHGQKSKKRWIIRFFRLSTVMPK